MKEIFTDILNISITAGILIGVCILVRCIFKKMPKYMRCLMWLLVAVRLAIPFTIESPFSMLPAKEYVVEQDQQIVISNEVKTAEMSEAPAVETKPAVDVMSVLAIVWLTGVGAVLIYGAVSYIRLRKLVADAVKYQKNIYQTDKIQTAFILGIFKPRIYGLSQTELFMSVSHEEAHIKRLDNLVKPLAFVITAFYWFNPLVWIAYTLLCKDIELACDEKVIRKIGYDKKKDYSQTLLNLSIPRHYIAACPVAFGEIGINERIKNVLKMKKTNKILIALAFALCAVLAVCFLTYPKESRLVKDSKAKANNEVSTGDVDEGTEVDYPEEDEGAEVDAPDDENVSEDNDGPVEVIVTDDSDDGVEVEAPEEDEDGPEEVNEPKDSDEDVEVDAPEEDEAAPENTTSAKAIWPIDGSIVITRQHSKDHNGIDIAAAEGTAVRSIFAGTVVETGKNDSDGYYIIIQSADGMKCKFAHFKDAATVSKGASVSAGTAVGAVGSTGNSTGPHLHMEISDKAGNSIDPLEIMPE